MAALGREFGRRVGRTLATAPLARRVRFGIGGGISVLGLVTLAVRATSVVG